LIFVPAYNEESNIGKTLQSIIVNKFPADLLVIDDGSADNTAQVARNFGASVLSHPINLGYGAAIQTGYKYAVKKEYKYVIHLDADGQHEPNSIHLFLEEMKKQDGDILVGSRFLNNQEYKTSYTRLIGIKLFAFIASKMMKQKVTDPTSGYQMLNRAAFEFFSQEIYPVDYPDVDVIVMAHKAGFRVREIPVTMYSRSEGISMHSGLKPFYYVFKMFLSLLVTLLRK
jgi:glycosyltransferase involved in cell wall biosynthesis